MFNIITKIKNWGIGHAVDSLDNLEQPLGDKIEAQLAKIRELDGRGLAKWIVDEVQDWLRLYFQLPPPPAKNG